MTNRAVLPRALRATVVVVSCVLGLSSLPAWSSQLGVSSGRLDASRTCTLTPIGSSSLAGTDARVQQGQPNNNFGSATVLNVDYGGSSNNIRTYLRFDLTKCTPAIASSAVVTSAVVRLWATSIPGSGACTTQDIFRVTSSWSESTLTWNNQPFGTATNNPASASRTSSINVGNGLGCQNSSASQYVTGWDVTTDVSAFVTGTANYGWMIRMDLENSSPARSTAYVAREANNANRSPQLIVDYR